MCIIKIIRQSLCLTQKALADQIGITQSAVSQIENERKNPSLKTIMLLYQLATENNINVNLSDLCFSNEESLKRKH